MTTPPSSDAQAIATRVMLALTGHRWTFPVRQVLEEYWVPETSASILLVGRPLVSVISVTDRSGNHAFEYEASDSFRLRLPQLERGEGFPFFPWPTYDSQNGSFYPGRLTRRGTHVRVTYAYGCRPPIDVQRAIDEFAAELDNAWNGRSCKLPERVTSISREGVTWTVLDPQQFLEGGKTGLYYPDLIISTYGGKVRMRAKVYSPEHRPPRRINSQLYVPPTEDGVSVSDNGGNTLLIGNSPGVLTGVTDNGDHTLTLETS